MRDQTYLVLLSLAEGPRHGYAIIAAAAELSDGRVQLGPGTLYGALDRLTAEGLVAESGTELVDGRARRYYQLTGHGGSELAEETAARARLARRAQRILRPSALGA